MNILVVDDDMVYLKMMKKILKRAFKNEVDITTTLCGNEAIKLSQQIPIDLILLDLNMPNISGTDVAKVLQHTKKTKDIPIIFVTSSSYEIFEKKGFPIGSVDYISKPIEVNLLINRVAFYFTIIKQNQLLIDANEKLKKKVHKQKDKSKIHKQILIYQSKTSVLGEMIGAIAHQWRQPLNIIATSMINLETKAELDILNLEDIRRINQKVSKTVESLSKTIDNFRNFFLLSDEKNELDLVDAINSTIELVKIQFKSHNIAINFEYDSDEEFKYYGYLSELRQVFMNFFANSQDSIELKMKTDNNIDGNIDISLEKLDSNYIIKICDNGGGIDKENIDKIFNPYFSTKFANQGTGTGLYMAKAIIGKHHKGQINIVNNSKDGVCFKIKL